MKSQKFGLGVIFILGASLFLSIYGCQESKVASGEPQYRALWDQMKSATDVSDKAKESLVKQVFADFEMMQGLFRVKEFHCLAKLMGKRGVSLVTIGSEKIPGGASAEYWRSVWKEGAELKLVPVNIYVSSLKPPQPVPYCAVMDEGITFEDWKKNPAYYDAVAVLTFEYRIIDKTGDISESVKDPVGTAMLLHRNICPWG